MVDEEEENYGTRTREAGRMQQCRRPGCVGGCVDRWMGEREAKEENHDDAHETTSEFSSSSMVWRVWLVTARATGTDVYWGAGQTGGFVRLSFFPVLHATGSDGHGLCYYVDGVCLLLLRRVCPGDESVARVEGGDVRHCRVDPWPVWTQSAHGLIISNYRPNSAALMPWTDPCNSPGPCDLLTVHVDHLNHFCVETR